MIQTVSPTALLGKPTLLAMCLAISVGSVGGCRRTEPDAPAVATPSLSLERDRVAIGSPVKLTYKFQVAPDAKIDGDYLVFAHVLSPDGDQMWTDDHVPPTPTSQWKPGQTIEYSRTVFVPNYPYVGEATIRLGLYQNEKRLVLDGADASRREYEVAKFQILPQSENIFLVDRSGWHAAEVAADNPSAEWRWTERRAVTSFRNPKKDATFYLEYDARADLFTPPQQVTIKLGDQVVTTFAAESKKTTLLTFPIAAAQFGTNDMVELALEVDRTFEPRGGDTRELGIRVFHTFIEPR
ncbi:MAG: hypothetical protein ACRD15_16710 [Vicinamibacterales bacterium]